MSRVAALLPAATGIVVALGAADRLVAITHACPQPTGLPLVPRVTRALVAPGDPSVVDRAVTARSGAGLPLFELDEALLRAVAPEVILMQAMCDVCAVRAEDVAAAAARLPVPPRLVSLAASTVDGVLQDVVAVGNALDLPDEAEELLAGLRGRMRRVHESLRRDRAPRPRVAVIEWTAPLFSAGHWVPDMVGRAGGTEVVGRAGTVSRRIGVDEVREAVPGIIIVAPCGVPLADAAAQGRALLEQPEWAWAAALPWWALDAASLTSSPGPGVVRGIEVLARVLHAGLFGSPSASAARRLS